MGILLSSTSRARGLVELIGVLIIFVFVLGITYLTTRWMGGFQKGKMKNKNLQILESLSVGGNKTLNIISAGKKYYVVAICKDSVQLISEISEEDLIDSSFDNDNGIMGQESFKEILSKMKNRLPKK